MTYKIPKEEEVVMKIMLFRVWVEDRMREIRSIFFKDGVAEYALLDVPSGENYEYAHLAHVPVMQYIGIEDSDGREIFEGDILSIDFGDEVELCNVQYFGNEGYPAFDVEVSFTPECNVISSAKSQGMTIKVVGNIYENPELMKSVKVRKS